jgi:general secretion pathway protein F
MALFRYKALSPPAKRSTGRWRPPAAAEVISKLQDAGNIPVEAKPADEAGSGGLAGLFKRSEMSGAQVLQFTQQLSTLLGAGQPLDRALQILLDLPESKEARRLIERIRETVRGGAPLSQALEQQHGVFSRLYVNMVRAGEVGGSLHDTLQTPGRLSRAQQGAARERDQRADLSGDPDCDGVRRAVAAARLRRAAIPAAVRGHGGGAAAADLDRAAAVGNFVSGYWWLLILVLLLEAVLWTCSESA